MKQIAFFEINDLPPTLNTVLRQHWAAKLRVVRRWKRLVAQQCVLHKVNGLKLEKATLVLTRHSSQETDFDNLIGSFKPVIDGLVEAGVIVDDNPSIIGLPTCIWKKGQPKKGKISVEILA